jgi:hypothetical protein
VNEKPLVPTTTSGGRTPIPTKQEAGRDEAKARDGEDFWGKNKPLRGIESRFVQPVALVNIRSTVCPKGAGHRMFHNRVIQKI